MPLNTLDRQRLLEALTLAEGSIGLSDPNPRVGCIVGRPDGQWLGRGFTQQAGGPHAEVMALRDAAGADLAGATAWVTLEPCAHHGRTPPCCDALIAARLGRVVVAIGDPFAQVAGQGIARLRAAGIEVVVATDAEAGAGAGAGAEIARAARALNVGFFSRVERGRPWLRLKAAASIDGTTALHNGASQWITGAAARADGHAWRRRAGAVISGIGTVLADDPRLDVRAVPTTVQPLRVVVDSQFRTPADARLLAAPGSVRIYGALDRDDPRAIALRAAGAAVLSLPDGAGRVGLDAVLADLARCEVNELHVEAGHTLNSALLRAGLVDELLFYMAPILLGPGRPIASLPVLDRLADGIGFEFLEVGPVGQDLRLRLRRRTGPDPAQSP